MVAPVTHRNRDRRPTNFEDGLYVGGIDILMLIKNSGNTSMATTGSFATSTERFIANQPGTGFAIGDIIERTKVIDTSVTPPTIMVIWYNFTKASTLTVAPSSAALTLESQTGLTNGELRATPLAIRTDANSPEMIRLGDLTDAAAPESGIGDYSLIAGTKRHVIQLSRLLDRLPGVLGQKANLSSLAVALSTEQQDILSNQSQRLSEIKLSVDQLLARLPANLGLKADSGSLSVVVSNDTLVWRNIGMTMSADGRILSETETNGSTNRTRTWTYVTNGDGSITSTPNSWV